MDEQTYHVVVVGALAEEAIDAGGMAVDVQGEVVEEEEESVTVAELERRIEEDACVHGTIAMLCRQPQVHIHLCTHTYTRARTLIHLHTS